MRIKTERRLRFTAAEPNLFKSRGNEEPTFSTFMQQILLSFLIKKGIWTHGDAR